MGQGEPGRGYPWPWVVYRWVEGTNPELGQLDDPDSLAADLAGFLRRLHRLDIPGGPATGRTPRTMDGAVRDAIARLDGRLTGVIDFSSIGVGDPANDLGVAWNLLPDRSRRIFAERLEVDDLTWLRGRGRALAQALVQLPYYHRTFPALADQARHVIGQVLADA